MIAASFWTWAALVSLGLVGGLVGLVVLIGCIGIILGK